MKFKNLPSVLLIGCMACAFGFANAEVKDASRASAQDVNDANTFLNSLPGVCGESHASASRDGSVTIKVICSGQSKGVVVIKGGKVIDLR